MSQISIWSPHRILGYVATGRRYLYRSQLLYSFHFCFQSKRVLALIYYVSNWILVSHASKCLNFLFQLPLFDIHVPDAGKVENAVHWKNFCQVDNAMFFQYLSLGEILEVFFFKHKNSVFLFFQTLAFWILAFPINLLNPKIKIWILICCPYSLPIEVVGRNWEKNQANSSCVIIMSVISMTTLFALILQGEIWCWSLLGLKGLKNGVQCFALSNNGIQYFGFLNTGIQGFVFPTNCGFCFFF